MFSLESLGRWLLIVGLSLAALGGLLWLLSKAPFLNKLGNLPGDIRYESEDGRLSCFIPLASSLLISLLLTILLNVIIRLLRR
jgi:tellurite resistance protein TehA-like permease